MAYTPTTPFGLPLYTGTVLPGQTPTTSLRPPAIDQGNPMNPHAYAQADAIQALKQSFKPKPYMPWFAQQAPAANWAKTYNTQAWMPPWVMTPGTVGTGGTNLGLGGMFGYTGNYGASPGPGINNSTTWGGFPTANPLQIRAVPPATLPGLPPTVPVIQQPGGGYVPITPTTPDPNAGLPATPVPKIPIAGGQKPVINPNNDIPYGIAPTPTAEYGSVNYPGYQPEFSVVAPTTPQTTPIPAEFLGNLQTPQPDQPYRFEPTIPENYQPTITNTPDGGIRTSLDLAQLYGPLYSIGDPEKGETFMQYAQRAGFPIGPYGMAAAMKASGKPPGEWYASLQEWY